MYIYKKQNRLTGITKANKLLQKKKKLKVTREICNQSFFIQFFIEKYNYQIC